ncbi:hypothetical protein GCK32_000203 [Trichostrongylus colubriformis]|uniref:DUF3715 domain-containing protein n=1 Tax=Trichostrongylus colubriformis TaxID=6319 RepID=A0AAN8EYU7_TRICO
MNFVIPKKKRVVEKPTVDVSSLEPKATIEDAAKDSPKFNTVKHIVLESVSDRQVTQFMHVEKVQLIKNPLLEFRYNQFKSALRSSGQSDAEGYGFLLIGFDDEDWMHICNNGYSVGTDFYGDLGLITRGVYVYRHVDLVTPSLFYKGEIMRVMVFRTLRGKSNAVGLGSTELEPTMDCSSHVAASDHIPAAKKSRQQLHRQSAVYHYEYKKDMTVADVPSGVLPYAVVDLRFDISERNQHSSILPTLGYVNDLLYFYPVYEGHLSICSAVFGKATLNTVFEDSCKPHGLDESLAFTKLLKWADAYDVRGLPQLMAPETWGLIAKQREVCVKNHNERSEKWKVRYVSHFVWMCNDPLFATTVNAMRVEQCAAIAYSIDATTYVAFPSSQFSNIFGLPWLQSPSLHVLVIHANPLFYADSNDVNCFSEETEITSKIPLGTAILDGDDVAICNSFDSQDRMKISQFTQPESRASAVGLPFTESPSPCNENSTKAVEASQSACLDTNDEEFTPLPPVPLPEFAGKSCLRNKPPQVFVEQPPLIGKSVPPPAPGAARNAVVGGALPVRKTRIRWSDSVVDNENKCGKKLSNDRDEAVKAGLHGRLPPKDLLTRKQPLTTAEQTGPQLTLNAPILASNPTPSTAVNKHKDLFQGVFNTIAKGGSADVDTADKGVESVPLVEQAPESTKSTSIPRRLGATKNCIITSLPLPLLSRNTDNCSRDPGVSSSASTGNSQSSEDELTVCDMEIESGSEGTPTPPTIKASPERTDEAVDFIDDHDADYDAQFMCDTTTSMDSQTSSCPSTASTTFGEEFTTATPNSKATSDQSESSTDNGLSSKDQKLNSVEPTSEPDAPASPPPTSVSEMPENVIRLLELLRANQPKPQCQDTDLRKLPPTSANAALKPNESGGQRRSRFDQPPPELKDPAGYVPKPVPTASIGFVGNVPALGASVMDTDLRSAPPATLAFSIKKTVTAPALNPPAPLVFGDDEDDDSDRPEDHQSKQKSERKDRFDKKDRDERKDRDDRRDRDDRIKRWDRPNNTPKPVPLPIPVEVPAPFPPQALGPSKEKPSENTKLFHILAGARLLQSQRDKKGAEYDTTGASAKAESPRNVPQARVEEPSLSSMRQPLNASTIIPTTLQSTSVSVANTSAPQNLPSRPNASVLGTAFGLSNDVIQQLLKRSTLSAGPPEKSTAQPPQVSMPDAPASPDPEWPDSPDAPASPDPEERGSCESSNKPKAQSEIPLDCWQPSEDKRTEPLGTGIITVRTPRKPKRPKDHDGAIANASGTDTVMDSWIKALEHKGDAASTSKRGKNNSSSRPSVDDEEEEGEILSDDEPQASAQPITVIGSASHNIHAAIIKQPEKSNPEVSRPPTLASTVRSVGEPAISGAGPGYFPGQPFAQLGQRRGFPPSGQATSFGNPQWPSYAPIHHPLQGSGFQSGVPRQEAPAITVIVPDFMMFNRAAMTRMDPAGFESFCERLKVVQTQENRIVSLQFHERLLNYVREMMQSLAGSETGNAFQMYYSVILKYKNLGIVHFMERHSCDDSDVCTAQIINCFTALRKNYYPSTVFIYMSNMSPGSSTGIALSSMGVRVMPPTSVMRSFGLDSPRQSF